MAGQNQNPAEGLTIKQTVDGVAVPTRERRSKEASRSDLKRYKSDPYLWGIYITLLIVSVIELFSASSSEVSGTNVYLPLVRHGIFLVLGLGIVLAFQNTPYGYFSRLAWFCAVVSLGLLVISNWFGVEINGAQRAIKIGGFTIQPPEIVKLTVVVVLARILGQHQQVRGVSKTGVWLAAGTVVVFGALLWKNGLTNTILLFGVSLAMFLIGGMKWKSFFMVILVYGALAGGLYLTKYTSSSTGEFDSVGQTAVVAQEGINRTGTQKGRIKRFLEGVNPDDPITDENRQVVFAKIAQANGGVFGQGPGNSRESARLPLAFSDYIYSIIIEDTGLVGGIFLLLLYLFLLARAGRIAYYCKRAFPAFLIMGCAVLIVFQALVHMAIVTGFFPVSGQPLPFISKGGTSILVMSAALGIMLSVSRYAVTTSDPKKNNKAELKGLPDDMQAANYSAQQTRK